MVVAGLLSGCFIAEERARRREAIGAAQAERMERIRVANAPRLAELEAQRQEEAQAEARSWRGRFGRLPPTPDAQAAHCRRFFGGLDGWWPTMRQVLAANDPQEMRDFLAVFDPCSGWLRVLPGSRFSVRGYEAFPDGPGAPRIDEIRRILLVNRAFIFTGAPGQFWPLDRGTVGQLQVELVRLTGG